MSAASGGLSQRLTPAGTIGLRPGKARLSFSWAPKSPEPKAARSRVAGVAGVVQTSRSDKDYKRLGPQ